MEKTITLEEAQAVIAAETLKTHWPVGTNLVSCYGDLFFGCSIEMPRDKYRELTASEIETLGIIPEIAKALGDK